jgi:hypothetical protein
MSRLRPMRQLLIWRKSLRQSAGYESAMMLHERILRWQAEHPTITWIFWIVVWVVVLALLFKPTRIGGMT